MIRIALRVNRSPSPPPSCRDGEWPHEGERGLECIVRSFTHAGRAHDYVKFLHVHGVSSAWIEIRYWRRGKGRQRPRIGAYDIVIAQSDMDPLRSISGQEREWLRERQ